MNPIPWFLRFAGGWRQIKADLNDWALVHDAPSYEDAPQRYRFHGWGVAGLPPRIACNVIHYSLSGRPIDCGRFPRD